MSALSSVSYSQHPVFVQSSSHSEVLLKQFPQITDFKRKLLEVGANCSISYTEVGNPNGIPAVFVHGGPGMEFTPEDLCWFDPEKFRIIAFDQRGCGMSKPSAKNPDDGLPEIYSGISIYTLITDMEKLRNHLNIDKWIVFGGSWGSTLSLFYAQERSQFCSGLVLRGIFLASEEENKDYFNPSRLKETPKWNPAAILALKNYCESQNLPFNLENSHECICSYKILVVDRNDFVAAHLWMAYETYVEESSEDNLQALLKLPTSREELDPLDRSGAIFETLLFKKLPTEIDLLAHREIEALRDIPIRIVQGVDDTETPPIFAEKLVGALRHADLDYFVDWVEYGTHTPYSERMTDALIHATNSFIK